MLTAKYAVYVPGTKNVDHPLATDERREWTLAVIEKMSYVFGGATSQEALGGWISENGHLVIENVSIVFSYSATKTAEYETAVRGIASWLAAELNQEAVSIETPDGMDFVSAAAA